MARRLSSVSPAASRQQPADRAPGRPDHQDGATQQVHAHDAARDSEIVLGDDQVNVELHTADAEDAARNIDAKGLGAPDPRPVLRCRAS